MKRVIVKASEEAKKRAVKASRTLDCTPPHLAEWYHQGTKAEAARLGYDVDYIGNPETVQMYKDEGYEWKGFILPNKEYADLLGDSGIGFLDVVADPSSGDLIAVMISSDRIWEVDEDEVQDMIE